MNFRNPLNHLRSILAPLALATLLGSAFVSTADAADGNALNSIDVRPMAGRQLQLILKLAGPAPAPSSFTIDDPARISIDLPDTTLALASRRIDVKSGGLDTIVAAQTPDRARLVLNLDKMLPYSTRVEGNDIVVMLGDSASAAANTATTQSTSAADATTPAAIPTSAPATPVARTIKGVDFRRSPEGAGRVIVQLTDSHTPINLRQVGGQIVVDFSGASLDPKLARRFDATDFGTSVNSFDITRAGNDTRLVINATGDYEQLAYQTDNQYVVEIQPKRKNQEELAQLERPRYTGEKMTMNFQDIDTRALLQLVADISGQNIVVSDTVHGNVTLRLQNVPWDQALDIVLRTKGLDKRQEGNVIIVAPADEIARREKEELTARQDRQQLEPLRSEYLQVNYAKAADIQKLIKAPNHSLLSPRGAVSVDDRTNTLLLQDTSDRLEDIRRMVAQLDIPVRQVRIEARLVLVNNDFQRELGAILGLSGVGKTGNTTFNTTGTAAGLDQMVQSQVAGGGNGLTAVPSAASRYNINLPAPTSAGSLALGVLGSDYLLDLELSAAQTETRADIISSPSIITANQKAAKILQGTEIPYQQSASSGAATVQFKEAVLSLDVTPQITPDNRVNLDLDVKKDSVGSIIVSSGGINVPSIDTQELKTSVLVNDGQTVVLGGILSTEHRTDITKVPFLGDVPVLGNLFKTTTKKDDKDELLIFVTPKILHEGINVY